MITEEQIEIWRAQHEHIYSIEIDDVTFVYRMLNREEYGLILEMNPDDDRMEEIVCEVACLYPEGFNFRSSEGFATVLSQAIMEQSGLTQGQAQQMLQLFREDIMTEESQIDCVIKEAFPEFVLEDIARWTVPKTMFYLSRAEWVIHVLRGGPRLYPYTPEEQKAIDEYNKLMDMPPALRQQMLMQKQAEEKKKRMAKLTEGPQEREERAPADQPENGELSQEELEAMLGVDLSNDSMKDLLKKGGLPEERWFASENEIGRE